MSTTVTGSGSDQRAPDDRRGRQRQFLVRLVLAASSGFVLFLSFAPRPLWWLAPLAFTGFALSVRNRRFWAGSGCGLVFGLAFFLPLLVWIQDFLGSDFGPWPWLGLSLVLALYLAVSGGVITLVAQLPAAPVWSALLVIALEVPRAWFPLGGFPWGRIAFSQPEGIFLSLASIGGTALVGFAVVLSGFGLASLLARMWERRWRSLTPSVVATVLPVVAGLAVWPTIGTEAQDGTRTVAAIQGNAADNGLGMLTNSSSMRRNHISESEHLIKDINSGRVRQPDLVVWPETATGLRVPDPRLDQLVADFHAPALIGAAVERKDGALENAMVAWYPDTGQGERYVKRQLVPFGEYVPMRSIARLVTPFVNAVDERVPGSGVPAVLPVADTKVGAMICYEAAYDYPSRDSVSAGAELLTAPTNNAWYGRSDMSYQHVAMSRLRAVEHSRAVVISATTGVSAIVQPDGSISSSTGLFTSDALVGDVPLRTHTTLADRLGQWTEYTLIGLAAVSVAAAFVSRSRAISVNDEHNNPTAGD